MFYPSGFPRQNAQEGLYTLTAQFNRDDPDHMGKLRDDPFFHCKYVISKELKPVLRERLRQNHGIWRGSLFPDASGAAQTTCELVFGK